jgi:hypothetical protein
MLLTVSTRSLQHVKREKEPLAPLDIPDFVAEQLGLKGLYVYSSLLKGMGAKDLERLRDRADRARCPVLVLVDETPLDFGGEEAAASIARVERLGLAASKLGAPAVGLALSALPQDRFDHYAANVKRSLASIERFETHLLIRPGDGQAGEPQRLADLIKKIGGFRIGSMPTFAHAASGDTDEVIRRLCPYAQAVEASVKAFGKTGKHESWDLVSMLESVRAVGYQNTLCIDYAGKTAPVATIERARDLLSAVIDPVEEDDEGEGGEDAE